MSSEPRGNLGTRVSTLLGWIGQCFRLVVERFWNLEERVADGGPYCEIPEMSFFPFSHFLSNIAVMLGVLYVIYLL